MEDAKAQMLQNLTEVPKGPLSGKDAVEYCQKKVMIHFYMEMRSSMVLPHGKQLLLSSRRKKCDSALPNRF